MIDGRRHGTRGRIAAMRRLILTFVLALLVALPMTQAVRTTGGALDAGSLKDWVRALLDLGQAGLSLGIAIVVLGLTDDPPRRPVWLYDWRALFGRHARAGAEPDYPTA
jgi:hypothetical protein